MRFIPESDAALQELEVTGDLGGLRDRVLHASGRVEALVPQCWGLSLSVVSANLTFTLVASKERVAALDAMQYLSGGPCVEAIRADRVVRTDELAGPLDESRWSAFARASAATGLRSTLSFPLHRGSAVVGGVNLYASAPGAFSGHEGELTSVLGG
jgi:GAF domain-containing protein